MMAAATDSRRRVAGYTFIGRDLFISLTHLWHNRHIHGWVFSHFQNSEADNTCCGAVLNLCLSGFPGELSEVC